MNKVEFDHSNTKRFATRMMHILSDGMHWRNLSRETREKGRGDECSYPLRNYPRRLRTKKAHIALVLFAGPPARLDGVAGMLAC